jgi:hypothetical protein
MVVLKLWSASLKASAGQRAMGRFVPAAAKQSF